MSILKKRIKDLSQDDLIALRKPLGVKGRPYPMEETSAVKDQSGKDVTIHRIGRLEFDPDDINDIENNVPLLVFSERSYAEVLGMALREMPKPSMLDLFFDALRRRDPGVGFDGEGNKQDSDSKRVIQFVKGKAGSGKTHMAKLIARMRSEEGALTVDCGEKNLSELLYEMVLDFGQNKKFYEEYNRRIKAYNAAETKAARDEIFHPQSINTLRAHLGEAFDEDQDGRISIDWDKTNKCLKSKDTGDYLSTVDTVKIVNEGLMSVADHEGFSGLAGGNSLGMATQEGPLIRAWKEGREIVLDEFNRGKPGSHASLHTVLQFLAGEIDETVAENTLKNKNERGSQSFVFRREDQKAGFFVTLTGNDGADGSDVEELPESLNSRIIPQHIAPATEQDWQHFWCQMLSGLPISTLYHIDAGKWDENPDAFREQLMQWRTLGLPESYVVPDYQMRRLQNWEDTLAATEKLARLCYGWSETVDPDSKLYRSGTLASLLEEVDEDYKKEVAIDFRKVIYWIDEARKMRPVVKSGTNGIGFKIGEDYSKPPKMPKTLVKKDESLGFGDRLSLVLLKHMEKTTAGYGKYDVHATLKRHASECGLQHPKFSEALPSQQRRISELLNYNPFKSRVMSVRAEMTRDVLCDMLREQDPRIAVSNDEMMTVRSVQAALEELEAQAPVNDNENMAEAKEKNEAEAETFATERDFIAFNDNIETLTREPLVKHKIVESFENGDMGKRPNASELATQQAILFALTAPVMREKNLEALWAETFTHSGLLHKDEKHANRSLDIAQGQDSEYAVTSLLTAADDKKKKTASLHILWNKKARKLLVVGDGNAPSSLRKAFNMAGTTYINRRDSHAAKKVANALTMVVGKAEDMSVLKNAFLLRAQGTSQRAEKEQDLAALMGGSRTKTYLPQTVISGPAV